MYTVDLAGLAKHSNGVAASSFGGISVRGAKVFTDWLTSRIRGIEQSHRPHPPSWENNLHRALAEVWQTDVLMLEGPDGFAKKVAEYVLKNMEDRPVYPIINSDWKSDAWLTGLVIQHMGDPDRLNPAAQGFGLTAKPLPEAGHDIALPDAYDLLYVDDASYSGTQVWNLLNSVSGSGLRPRRLFLMLAGISQTAQNKIWTSALWKNKCTPAADPAITKTMKAWNPPGTIRLLLQSFYGPMTHIEADPQTLDPRPTTGEYPIFMDNCLAILPYKIPDSVSVPTHLYLAYDPQTRSSIFEREGGHLFQSNGGTTYRTVMREGADSYAKKM